MASMSESQCWDFFWIEKNDSLLPRGEGLFILHLICVHGANGTSVISVTA